MSRPGSAATRVLTLLLVFASLAIMGVLFTLLAGYKHYFIPSEGMAPTLLKGDHLVARRGRPGEIRRGDIILFPVGDAVYIKRVAALSGDRIALKRGVVVLNGRPVPQQLVRIEATESLGEPLEARRLREQFPGETAPHEVYDLGDSVVDDWPEETVAPGHLFVLGDNRDRSADSRVSRAAGGVEQLPLAQVVGDAAIYLWGPSGKFGERIGAPE